MKEEIDAAADFLSRIFLSHEKIAKEKVKEFNARLADALLDRFRDHWHEGCPTKGQAYRCIRICPEETLDPLLEKVCNSVGVCVSEFQLPMELTLWVDPKEVVCKFGDLKCSYHVVAKKDQSSGTMNNQTEQMDIEDLVESARELYQKKQSMMAHPLNSSEIHIPGYCADGTSNRFSTALRINGTVHYNMYSTSPGSSYDGSPRGKGKSAHSPHHKRGGNGNGNGGGGFHFYSGGGKNSSNNNGNGKGFMANGISNGHSGMNSHHHHQGGNGNGNGNGGGGFHRSSHHHHHHHHGGHHHHHQQHHHQQQQHHHHHGSPTSTTTSTAYQNGFMNGYHEESSGYPGFATEHHHQRSVSPSKMNGVSPGANSGGSNSTATTNGLPPLAPMSQGSPTPEQIQQQMQHPPPMPPPPPIPPHIHQPYSQPPPPPTDPASLSLPPPPTSSSTSSGSQQQPNNQHQQQQQSSSATANFASSSTTATSSSSISNNNNSGSNSGGGNSSSSSGNNNNNSSNSASNSNSGGHSGNNSGKSSNHNHKYQSGRGGGSRGGNNRQTSPVKDVK